MISKRPEFQSPTRIGREGLELLYPPFAVKVLDLEAACKRDKLPMGIFETIRSAARQLDLYNNGASKIKTNGMHYYGVACDFVGVDKNGAWTWALPQKQWDYFGHLARSVGLFWGGDWKSFKDLPHVQICKATADEQGKIIKGIYP